MIFNKLFSINRKGIKQIVVYFLGFKFTFTSKKFTKKYCISQEEWIEFIEQINGSQYANEGDSLYFLRNKTILLKRLGNNLKRSFIDLNECSYADYEQFINSHKKFIAKNIVGCSGNNMKIYNLDKNSENIKNLYDSLLNNKTCLLEEYVQQCKILNDIYPEIVSTVRIYTLNINNSVELISYSLLRIPTAEAGIRNAELMIMKINPDTGICADYCILVKNRKKSIVENPIHPYNNYPLSNFKVPYFEEIKQLALSAAKYIPEIVYAGWDIAITDKGPVVIEGNGAPYSFREENHITTYENGLNRTVFYTDILKYYKFRKNLSTNQIENITNKVFLNNTVTDIDFDFVIILGSSKCEYRAEYFCELYKNKNKIPYIIASGGNRFSGEYEYNKIANTLKKYNIPENKIIFEKKAKNSRQNIIYSLKIIKKFISKRKYNRTTKNEKLNIGIITAGFHSVRINNLAEKYRNKYNIEILSAYGENTAKETWYRTYNGYKIIMDELSKNIQ